MTEPLLRCAVCMEMVNKADQRTHLETRHPAPAGGFKFFYNGQTFYSEKPSMYVRDLLALVNGNVMGHFYMERTKRDGGDVAFAHGEAVDLTRQPRFYTLLPATY